MRTTHPHVANAIRGHDAFFLGLETYLRVIHPNENIELETSSIDGEPSMTFVSPDIRLIAFILPDEETSDRSQDTLIFGIRDLIHEYSNELKIIKIIETIKALSKDPCNEISKVIQIDCDENPENPSGFEMQFIRHFMA